MTTRPTRRRSGAVGVGVILAASLLWLTGCGDGADPGAEAAASASSSGTASASTSPDEGPEAPEAPELLEEREIDGAMAAVHYWFDVTNHARDTGDISGLDEVTLDDCLRCERDKTRWTELAAEDCTIEFQGEPEHSIYRAEVFEGWEYARVFVQYSEPAAVEHGEDCDQTYEAYDDGLVVDLAYLETDGGWKIEQLYTWDDYDTLMQENVESSE